MAMRASAFLEGFQRAKKHLAEHADAHPDLRAALEKATAAFRHTYTPEAFKEAIAADTQVPDALEEAVTSLLILLQRERTRDSAHAESSEPTEGD
jgi:hypothetical protein